MHTLINRLLILALVLSSGSAIAGAHVVSGGATSWVCRVNGHVQWAKLLDLYEAADPAQNNWQRLPVLDIAEILYRNSVGEPLKYSSLQAALIKAVHAHYQNVLAEMGLDGVMDLAASRTALVDRMTAPDDPVSSDTWKSVDYGSTKTPPASACVGGLLSLENAYVYFDHTDSVSVNAEIIAKMPLAEVAVVAVMHEIIYKYYRATFNDTTSKRARYLVGLIFSHMTAQKRAALACKNLPELYTGGRQVLCRNQ